VDWTEPETELVRIPDVVVDQLVWYMERLFFAALPQILVTKLPVLCVNFVSVERKESVPLSESRVNTALS
jgi:hypothetical protein